jgi:hypothetical protein
MRHAPSLPPGFLPIPCTGDPLAAAIELAVSGAEPGTLLHGDLCERCNVAIVLAPDRPIDEACMLSIVSRAVHSTIAGFVPPGLPIDIAGALILLNGGEVARLAIRVAPLVVDGVPDWLIAVIDVAVDFRDPDPGLHPERTCLAEEGAEASPEEVLAAICRHLLTGIDTWSHAETRDAA